METNVREDTLLTVGEVAEILRVPCSWVYEQTRERCRDRIPGIRLGKYWRFVDNKCSVMLRHKPRSRTTFSRWKNRSEVR